MKHKMNKAGGKMAPPMTKKAEGKTARPAKVKVMEPANAQAKRTLDRSRAGMK